MQEVFAFILRVAPTRHPVLIIGESGTGKELVAQAIHRSSPWSNKPFIPIDCGALSPTVIESELFGHAHGAFTGAIRSRRGLLAAANGGTIFLDEVAEIPYPLQAKLLRALQEYEIRPIGENEGRPIDGRIIAAANRDLWDAMERHEFRRDLYFRLNVVSIVLPPLRERRSDIPALIDHFLGRFRASQFGVRGVSDEALACMMRHDWPGNVRELENCIRRAIVIGAGPQIRVRDLPPEVVKQAHAGICSQTVVPLREVERQAILGALRVTRGDRLRAARLLGIGKTTMYRKLKEYARGEQASLPSHNLVL